MEFRLSQKEEQISRLEDMAETSGFIIHSNERTGLENILKAKESELVNAEMKINQLLNERNEKLDTLENKQLRAQLRVYKDNFSENDIRMNFSNLQVFDSEVLFAIEDMFSKTIGLENQFVSGNMSELSR